MYGYVERKNNPKDPDTRHESDVTKERKNEVLLSYVVHTKLQLRAYVE